MEIEEAREILRDGQGIEERAFARGRMTDKMTIEKAREKFGEFDNNSFKACCFSWWEAKGFIEGYESRQEEIDRLKEDLSLAEEEIIWRKRKQIEVEAQNEKMREALEKIATCDCEANENTELTHYCDGKKARIAEVALKGE